ncbi:uncharacterized protein J3D65DRAFT_418665 [Phyllosticta citribraziliensis]|uniref:Secreted protein n=1 Tax=Phyllosticta citribraziliensis TaxID=989973 RepID=A0ABR1LML5_9PEZI
MFAGLACALCVGVSSWESESLFVGKQLRPIQSSRASTSGSAAATQPRRPRQRQRRAYTSSQIGIFRGQRERQSAIVTVGFLRALPVFNEIGNACGGAVSIAESRAGTRLLPGGGRYRYAARSTTVTMLRAARYTFCLIFTTLSCSATVSFKRAVCIV